MGIVSCRLRLRWIHIDLCIVVADLSLVVLRYDFSVGIHRFFLDKLFLFLIESLEDRYFLNGVWVISVYGSTTFRYALIRCEVIVPMFSSLVPEAAPQSFGTFLPYLCLFVEYEGFESVILSVWFVIISSEYVHVLVFGEDNPFDFVNFRVSTIQQDIWYCFGCTDRFIEAIDLRDESELFITLWSNVVVLFVLVICYLTYCFCLRRSVITFEDVFTVIYYIWFVRVRCWFWRMLLYFERESKVWYVYTQSEDRYIYGPFPTEFMFKS